MKLSHCVQAFLVTLILSLLPAFASQYVEKVEVPSRSPAERPVYLANGLNQLVNNITENPAASQKPEVVKAQTNALEYVLSYQYITESDPLNPQGTKLYLKIDFDTRAVQKLLKTAKLSLPPVQEEIVVIHNPEPAQNDKNAFILVVDNIDEAADYKEVMNYLSGFEAISAIQVVELAPPQVTFDLTVQGGASHLKQLFLLGHVLVPEVQTDFVREVSEAQPILKYRYQP